MPISRSTVKAVRQLAEVIVHGTDDEDTPRSFSFRSAHFPESLRDLAGDTEGLTISGREFYLYESALALLDREDELEHAKTREIDKDLWEFVCQLFLQRGAFRDGKKRAELVDDFLDRIRKPWEAYDVISELQHLEIKDNVLDIGGVRFFRLMPEEANEWGLRDRGPSDPLVRDLAGKTVALTRVRAGSPKRAADRARIEVDDALNTLRFALAEAIRVRIWDEQMLFRRGGTLGVKPVVEGKSVLASRQRGFSPIDFQMDDRLANIVDGVLKKLDLPSKTSLGGHLLRAVHWIGTSVTRESFDDKIIDLCTALEALLTLRSDRRKGEAIALRSMLAPSVIGEGFDHPVNLLSLYELRSRVIHGSEIRMCSDRQYMHLRSVAISTLVSVIKLVHQDRSLTTLTKLINAIETPDLLAHAIEWLERQPYAEAGRIADFAKERLRAKGR